MIWTTQEIETLARMARDGSTAQEISNTLKNKSRNAVCAMASRKMIKLGQRLRKRYALTNKTKIGKKSYA